MITDNSGVAQVYNRLCVSSIPPREWSYMLTDAFISQINISNSSWQKSTFTMIQHNYFSSHVLYTLSHLYNFIAYIIMTVHHYQYALMKQSVRWLSELSLQGAV